MQESASRKLGEGGGGCFGGMVWPSGRVVGIRDPVPLGTCTFCLYNFFLYIVLFFFFSLHILEDPQEVSAAPATRPHGPPSCHGGAFPSNASIGSLAARSYPRTLVLSYHQRLSSALAVPIAPTGAHHFGTLSRCLHNRTRFRGGDGARRRSKRSRPRSLLRGMVWPSSGS